MLGLVHRDIGVFLECLLVQAILWEDTDADAGGHPELLALEVEGPGNGAEDFLGGGCHVLVIGQLRQQDHEFVAAQSGHRIAGAQTRLESQRHFLEQLIAGIVPKRIVDLLEAVEVKEQHRQLPMITTCLADALAQQHAEQTAIGQRRKAVVIGQILDIFGVGNFRFASAQAALHQLPTHPGEQPRQQHQQ
ncbi:hypothetical protein D3C76_1267470 [compost metagenome]